MKAILTIVCGSFWFASAWHYEESAGRYVPDGWTPPGVSAKDEGPNGMPPWFHFPGFQKLPSYDASKYPGFSIAFRQGECDANDSQFGQPVGPINKAKMCYSCFRIPSLARNPKTGTLFAFAEARRRELEAWTMGLTWPGEFFCPDVPDTAIAYKRSTDGGLSWGPLQILAKEPGVYQGQPSPIFDHTTGTLMLVYIDGSWANENVKIMTSTDDGVTWSKPKSAVAAPGSPPLVLSTNAARGHVVVNGSSVRLLYPSQGGSMYSDDHGATWSIGPVPVGMCGRTANCMGEANFMRCTLGEACNGNNWVVVNRCVDKPNPQMDCKSMAFSKDGIHWDPPVTLNVTRFAPINAAPGAVGVPGALVISHVGGNGSDMSDYRHANIGMDLLYSTDGKEWNLFKRAWPLHGGYSTIAAYDEDASGAATHFGTLYEAGWMQDKAQEYIIFQNFTWDKPSGATREAPVVV